MTPPDASPLMKRGIALLNENTEVSLTEAVDLFDQALALRRETLLPGDHWMAYLTAASWMNRGDALTRLAKPGMLDEAVRSYDEALALMREVPLDANVLYRRRLAIAWMNRGITLHQLGTAADYAAAVKSFGQAIEVLREYSEHTVLLACAWMNRASAQLRTDPPQPIQARASATSALSLVEDLELTDLLAAETALKARHVICQAIAELMAVTSAVEESSELASFATDAVEEGMRVARHWESQGEKSFRTLLADFFRFGLAVYRTHQPQFLAEFVLDNLDPDRPQAVFSDDPEMHTRASEALAAAAGALQSEGFAAVRTARFDHLLEILKAHQWVESRRDHGDVSAG